jgi:hypothetical protein
VQLNLLQTYTPTELECVVTYLCTLWVTLVAVPKYRIEGLIALMNVKVFCWEEDACRSSEKFTETQNHQFCD